MLRGPMSPPTVRHSELLAYRDEFPLLAATTYLNTCSLGARSRRSTNHLDSFLADWDSLGARAWYRRWLGLLDQLRADFGAILGVPGSEISLAASVSAALAVVASALDPLHRGDGAALGRLRDAGVPVGKGPRTRVVTTALDFPTIGHQWLARGALGVELVVVPSRDGLTVPLEDLAQAIDERTALVAIGHVFFTSGALNDLDALSELCRERGALLLVDAYQATGLVPTNLGTTDIDLYVSGTLKWLHGGPGTAFLRVRPGLWDALLPTTTGWFSSARQFDFTVDALDLATDGRRYELGTPSVPSAAIARGGMELVREIGVDRLGERSRDLGDLLIALADARGLDARVIRDPERRGGIVAIGAEDPRAVVNALADEGIIVDFRPGIVRCSPAFYNTEAEVELLVDRLAFHVRGAPATVS